ncbi:hypothetical protein V2J09_016858 [Rumex salicifolius]
MACSSAVHSYLRPISHNSTDRGLAHSLEYLSSNSICSLRSTFIFPKLRSRRLRTRTYVVAFQNNIFRALQTALKVGKEGVEAGTNLVPESVPRPIAKLSVTVAAAAVSLFVLRSFVSTALFAVGTMGFIYFIYLALNKDKGSKTDVGSKSSDDAVEEAKRIMDKYKNVLIVVHVTSRSHS